VKNWLRRIRGAVGMGIAWAIGWGFAGFLFEGILNILPGNDLGHIVDMWPPVFAVIGFLVGVVFSIALGIAAARRRFDELSIPGFSALGALGGLLLSGAALAAGLAGAWDPLWLRAAVLMGTPVLLSAASAAGTLAVARMAERKSLASGRDANINP
jgi:hypothetical protein